MCPSAPAPSVEMEVVSQVHVSPAADEVGQQATPPEVTTVEEAAPDPPGESCCVGGFSEDDKQMCPTLQVHPHHA